MLVPINCDYCGKVFLKESRYIKYNNKHGMHHYCGHGCAHHHSWPPPKEVHHIEIHDNYKHIAYTISPTDCYNVINCNIDAREKVVIKDENKKFIDLDIWLYNKKHNVEVDTYDQYIKFTCGNNWCVNVDHMICADIERDEKGKKIKK